MPKLASLVAAAGIFASGAVFDRLIAKKAPVSEPSLCPSLAAPPAARNASHHATTSPSSTQNDVPPSRRELSDNSIERPRNAFAILSAEEEAQLTDILVRPIATPLHPMRNSMPDGSFDLGGEDEEGRNILQHFTARGALKNESWRKPATGGQPMLIFSAQ